jgi:hypothetical protein
MKVTTLERIYPLSPETAKRMAYEWSNSLWDYRIRLENYQENIQAYYREMANDYLGEEA